jgi:serine/threonine protein kinase
VTIASGTKLGRYDIRRQPGAGAIGEVYLAQDTIFGRRVAIKILPREFAADADRMRRFVLEAKSASALNHPNITKIYEIGLPGISRELHLLAITRGNSYV